MCVTCVQVSWTAALRKVVLNCYHHHGREDLLPDYKDNSPTSTTLNYTGSQSIVVQHINNPDGSVSLVHIDTGDNGQPQQMVTLSDGTQARVVHTVTYSAVIISQVIDWNFNQIFLQRNSVETFSILELSNVQNVMKKPLTASTTQFLLLISGKCELLNYYCLYY